MVVVVAIAAVCIAYVPVVVLACGFNWCYCQLPLPLSLSCDMGAFGYGYVRITNYGLFNWPWPSNSANGTYSYSQGAFRTRTKKEKNPDMRGLISNSPVGHLPKVSFSRPPSWVVFAHPPHPHPARSVLCVSTSTPWSKLQGRCLLHTHATYIPYTTLSCCLRHDLVGPKQQLPPLLIVEVRHLDAVQTNDAGAEVTARQPRRRWWR